MFPRFLLVLALSLASAGCDSIFDFLGISPNETLEVPHPYGMNDNPYHNNSLDDQQGLAGLEVKLTGAIGRTFTAEDLPIKPFSVASRGWVYAEVSLSVNQTVIAQGMASWALKRNTEWKLQFSRGESNPAPSFPPAPGKPVEPCDWPGCQDYWRFEISDGYGNYDDDALWVVLYGYEPCSEGNICN